jgi:hypothetical protein
VFQLDEKRWMHSWRRLQHHPGIIPGCVSCSPASRRGKSDQQDSCDRRSHDSRTARTRT